MIAALAASLLLSATPAHIPSVRDAQRRAASEARAIARVVSTPTSRITSTGAGGCRRKPSYRAVDCKMYFRYGKSRTCTWKLRVSYASRKSQRLKVRRLGEPSC